MFESLPTSNAPTKELARCWLARVATPWRLAQLSSRIRSLVDTCSRSFCTCEIGRSYGPLARVPNPKIGTATLRASKAGVVSRSTAAGCCSAAAFRLGRRLGFDATHAELASGTKLSRCWLAHLRHSRMVHGLLRGSSASALAPSAAEAVAGYKRLAFQLASPVLPAQFSTPDVHAAATRYQTAWPVTRSHSHFHASCRRG